MAWQPEKLKRWQCTSCGWHQVITSDVFVPLTRCPHCAQPVVVKPMDLLTDILRRLTQP